jgi:hypothetical protein
LVKFGRSVRDEAVAKGWRYEVLNSGDEGLLLYLQKPHFIRRENAIAEWNRENIDTLIAPADDAAHLLVDLPASSIVRKDERGMYILLRR